MRGHIILWWCVWFDTKRSPWDVIDNSMSSSEGVLNMERNGEAMSRVPRAECVTLNPISFGPSMTYCLKYPFTQCYLLLLFVYFGDVHYHLYYSICCNSKKQHVTPRGHSLLSNGNDTTVSQQQRSYRHFLCVVTRCEVAFRTTSEGVSGSQQHEGWSPTTACTVVAFSSNHTRD